MTRGTAAAVARCTHPPLAERDQRWLAELVQRECGVVLQVEKAYLVHTRLTAVAAALGLPTVAALLARLRTEQGAGTCAARPATLAVCDALTTNETLFFRDGHPFEALRRQVLPALAAARLRDGVARTEPIRIWSAACSTGQEPYSIAMCAALAAPELAGIPVEIVATDYSARAVARACEGRYSEFEARRGLAPEHLARFFVADAGGLRVAPALRRTVRVQRQNLLEPCTALGSFDVVFCRNVLLYFDPTTRARVLDTLADAMRPGALLFLGGTESVLGTSARFRRSERCVSLAFERADG